MADPTLSYDRRLAGWWRWAAVLTPGLLLYLLPLPGLTSMQRHLLAIFAATIVALWRSHCRWERAWWYP